MHFIANSSWQAQRDAAPLKINMESSNRHHCDNYLLGLKELLLGFSKHPEQKREAPHVTIYTWEQTFANINLNKNAAFFLFCPQHT